MKRNILLAVAGIILVLLWWAISIYPDWLWFGRLGYAPVFWTTIATKVGLGLSICLFFILITLISVIAAGKLSKRAGLIPITKSPDNPLSQAGLAGSYISGARQSPTAALPELKRIIVAFGNRVTMERDLQTALSALLGRTSYIPSTQVGPKQADLPSSDLALQALEHYKKAQAFLRKGDWAGYGKELDSLEKILKQMAKQKTDE